VTVTVIINALKAKVTIPGCVSTSFYTFDTGDMKCEVPVIN
jgi:hypothetical protein